MTWWKLSSRGWGRWLVGLCFWTVIGLSFASQLYLSSAKWGRPVSWTQAVASSLADWYVWALLSLPIVQLARRFRFDAPVWVRNLGIHLGASVVCSLVYALLRAWVGQWQAWWVGVPLGFSEAFGPLVTKTFQFNLLIYWVIVSVSHAFSYYRQSQERALRAGELEQRLTQARLLALQMQLNPHFLFNTLNAISSLMHKDVKAADRMLARLGDLLRYALDSTGAHEVPLRKELEFLGRFLEIEQTRFGPRLEVRLEVDPGVTEAMVPSLILQPLVENAIKHGIEKRARDGLIELRAYSQNGSLCLEVRDNGPGIRPDRSGREGIGVANTRARLEQLYGDAQDFELRNGEAGGVVARVRVPLRPPDQPANPRDPAA
jgi:two-component system, LytTR family, sensor kinase